MRRFALAFLASPAVIPIHWHSSHGRWKAFLLPHFQSVAVISTTSDTERLLHTVSQIHSVPSPSKYVVQILAWFGFFLFCFVYKITLKIFSFASFKLLTIKLIHKFICYFICFCGACSRASVILISRLCICPEEISLSDCILKYNVICCGYATLDLIVSGYSFSRFSPGEVAAEELIEPAGQDVFSFGVGAKAQLQFYFQLPSSQSCGCWSFSLILRVKPLPWITRSRGHFNSTLRIRTVVQI